MLKGLFRAGRNRRLIDQMYASVVAQARQPAFYAQLGVADRIDARFELYTLHVQLLAMRLAQEGQEGSDIGEDLFSTYVSALDHTLRELGVGDISVGKKMRKLGESLYGRLKRYEPLLQHQDREELAAALAKNVYETDDAASGVALADYALRAQRSLAEQSMKQLLQEPHWPEIVQ